MMQLLRQEQWNKKRVYFSETATVYGWSENTGIHAFAAVTNSLTAAGAGNLGVGIEIQYPAHVDKRGIYRMEKNLKKICSERNISFLESEMTVNPLLPVPQIMVNGIGDTLAEDGCSEIKNVTGGDIVLTKWIGMDGMLRIATEKKEELEKHFAPDFIRQIFSHRQEIFADKEIEEAKMQGVSRICQITEGGVLAALWKLAKEMDTGLEVDMKKISILQETVEVCEYFRLNPYQLASAGSFLMVTDDGEKLVEALEEQQVKASLIGRLAENNDKIMKNGEDIRYIDRPAPDEIYKIFTEDTYERY